MSANGKKPLSIDELLERTHPVCKRDGEILDIERDPGHSVYNITPPFHYNGRWLIAGRTEELDDEVGTKTRFYSHYDKTDSWHHVTSLPTLPLQDPFVTKVHSEWVVGGVKVFPHPDEPKKVSRFDTWLYRGDRLEELRHFATIADMKDVRLAANNAHIDVLTRPQGEKGGLGKIGYLAVGSVREINNDTIQAAPIVEGLFAHVNGEWGGSNQIVPLSGSKIGIHGHIARFNGWTPGAEHPNRQYFGIAAILDTATLEVSGERILACRDCFPDTIQPKRDDLREVVFMGGVSVQGVMYAGVGDSTGARKVVGNTLLGI